MKRTLVALVVIAVLCAGVIVGRHRIMVYAMASQGAPPLLEPSDEGPGGCWYDDYFWDGVDSELEGLPDAVGCYKSSASASFNVSRSIIQAS